MYVDNILQMNDWKIEKFLTIVFAIQLSMWGTIGLDAIGLHIPILRQFIAGIYLFFVPGIIIIRILKLHKINSIESLLYSVGLSIATLMFTGFFMNIFYPQIGISKPLSLMPLIVTISIVVLVLCAICYKRDKDFCDTSYIEVKDIYSVPVLFLLLIPFFAIFGTYLVNFYRNNSLLMLMFILISITILLIGFDKFIHKKLYPLVVFIIAISLLFHNSLISMYISGWDIQIEYHYADLIMSNSVWNLTIPNNVNAMLSIVMLAPIYSNISGMNLTWIFKIIYPLLFSLVPLGLYQVFQKQTNDKIAFLSTIFFMSIFPFFLEMLQLARQQIAEFYLVLIILLIVDNNINRLNRAILIIIFALSISVSHYGLSYIFMGSLIIVWILLYFHEQIEYVKNKPIITTSFVLLFITFTLSWYIYISSSMTFNTIVYIGDHILDKIYIEFLSPKSVQGISLILTETESFLHTITKYLHITSQIFITIGLLTILSNRKKMKFEKEYVAFSIVNFLILVAGMTIPYFASSLNTSRLYHIALIFLAPFCIIGGMTVFEVLSKVLAKPWRNRYENYSHRFLSIFLVFFLLFNSGWIYEVASEKKTSFSLSNNVNFPLFNEQDHSGLTWLINYNYDNVKKYADLHRWLLLLSGFDREAIAMIPKNDDEMLKNRVVFFKSFDTVHEQNINWGRATPNFSFQNMNKIYVNGGVEVHK